MFIKLNNNSPKLKDLITKKQSDIKLEIYLCTLIIILIIDSFIRIWI